MFFDLKWLLWPSISQKIFGGIAFSEPQQFSELENYGPLGAGGGVHGEVSRPIDYKPLPIYIVLLIVFVNLLFYPVSDINNTTSWHTLLLISAL